MIHYQYFKRNQYCHVIAAYRTRERHCRQKKIQFGKFEDYSLRNGKPNASHSRPRTHSQLNLIEEQGIFPSPFHSCTLPPIPTLSSLQVV